RVRSRAPAAHPGRRARPRLLAQLLRQEPPRALRERRRRQLDHGPSRQPRPPPRRAPLPPSRRTLTPFARRRPNPHHGPRPRHHPTVAPPAPFPHTHSSKQFRQAEAEPTPAPMKQAGRERMIDRNTRLPDVAQAAVGVAWWSVRGRKDPFPKSGGGSNA